jgi:hypothetical protein
VCLGYVVTTQGIEMAKQRFSKFDFG